MNNKTPNIIYETLAEGIARITLNRPEVANAQDTDLLYSLNDAFDRAAHDDAVKVIILAANGKPPGWRGVDPMKPGFKAYLI